MPPLASEDISSAGFQSQIWGLFFLVQVFWAGEPRMELNSLFLREGLSGDIPPASGVWILTRLWICSSYSSWFGFFFKSFVVVKSVQLVFRSSFSYVFTDLFCLWKEVSSRSSYSAILITSPQEECVLCCLWKECSGYVC